MLLLENLCLANRRPPSADMPAIPAELLEQFGNGFAVATMQSITVTF